MARCPEEFRYSYEDLVELSGMTKNTVYQHVRRGNLDPGSLASVLIWLARHGTLDLRTRMISFALLRELGDGGKPRGKRRKAAGRARGKAKG